MGTWTAERILSLAPDAGSAKAGRELSAARKWTTLGKTDVALWGEIKGSGAKPYQTQIDLTEPAFRCSCPSRKFPCKHALGLFLLSETSESAFTEKQTPAWVTEWLSQRAAKAEKKAVAGEEKPAAVTDPEAAAKRLAQREKKVAAGVKELQLWLTDVIRQGLASVVGKPHHFWEGPAARMVDAQAPGLGRAVREMSSIPATGEGWQGRLLDRLARLHLLLEGHFRLSSLPAETQADIRSLIGFTVNQDEVLAQAGVRDRWLVLGQKIEMEDRLRVLSTWLMGRQTKRFALILTFAHATQPMDASLSPGTEADAEVVFYPGSVPLRALIKQRRGPVAGVMELPPGQSIGDALGSYAETLAKNPWIERFPMLLRDVTAARLPEGWIIRDGEGRFFQLGSRAFGWDLLAISGGAPVTVFGEYNGHQFHPYSAYADERFSLLKGVYESVG